MYLLKVFEWPELYKRFQSQAAKFEGVHTKFKVNYQNTRLFQLLIIFEPPRGKTNNLHRRKQRRRSASR